jgi:ribonuclease R
VTAFGLFVTLRDFFVEGLVPVSALGDDFYVYEQKQHRLRGRSSGRIYRLGDAIRVQLKGIDEARRRLDFRLPGATPDRAEARERPRRSKAGPAGELRRRGARR